MNRLPLVSLCVLSTVAMLTACKLAPKNGPSGADTKSLEDLAHKPGSTGPAYRCGGVYNAAAAPNYITALKDLIEPADTPLKDVILGTAQALPAPVAHLLTGTQTRIRLVSDAVAQCAATPFNAAEKAVVGRADPVKACWRQTAPGERPELILQADATVIQQSFVRLGAYLFSEFLMTRVADSSAPAPFNAPAWQAAAKAFQTARGDIAKALLIDLKNFDDETVTKFSSMNAADAAAFGNVAIAEAQDSYYCNADSRHAFAALLRTTYGVFSDSSNPASMVSLFGAR